MGEAYLFLVTSYSTIFEESSHAEARVGADL